MRICYFGLYNRNFSRNKIYMRGLEQLGVDVVECQSNARGIFKYWHVWRKHKALAGAYDAIVVGYPGHIMIPFAKLISHKPVIGDLLGSLYDAEKHSHYAGVIHLLKLRIIDWLAVKCADKILLESEAQLKYFEGRFGTSKKYVVVYTGVDEEVFGHERLPTHVDSGSDHQKFIVLFRGKLTPECGIGHILDAAFLLKNQSSIHVRIIGTGYLLEETKKYIQDKKLDNVSLVSTYISDEEMRSMVQGASLYLGQFEDNHRLKRTIPHKAFEAFVAEIPYLSEDAPAIRELVVDSQTGFLVPAADPALIAEKILWLSQNPLILKKVAASAKKMYKEKLSPTKLVKKILEAVAE